MTLARREVLFGIASLPPLGLPRGRALPGLAATVHNGYELDTALRAAGPGSTVTLAAGDYGDVGRFVLDRSRVVLRARSPRRTVFRVPMVAAGSSVDLDGLAFADGLHLVGAGLRIADASFTSRLRITGVDVEVAGCEFADIAGYAVQIAGTARDPYVHDNYFHDSRGKSGGSSAIAVGVSTSDTDKRIGARIESNRIERWVSESETICIKSSGNMVRNNTLIGSRNISGRHGEGNTFDGNTLDNSRYWIAVHDRGNRITDNRASIRVMGGNVGPGGNLQGKHPRAWGTYVAGNSGRLVIGYCYRGHTLPAVETTVASHSGTITLENHVGTKLPGGANAA